jgi:serine/threonine protein kinase
MDTALAHPERIAQYEITEKLALMGKVRVYRAFDLVGKRSAVLRTISKDPKDPEVAQVISQFQKQAQASVGLKHPGIVEIYECSEDASVAFIASEIVEGCNLKTPLRVPISDAASLSAQLLDALEYAHSRGVVHSHVMPSNLILTSKGELKLADFGVAYSGTLSTYLSPEQAAGSEVDHRVDIFATGVFFYELLAGAAPFPDSPENFAESVRRDAVKPPSAMNPQVPPVFDRVCAKSMAKLPGDRYTTAEAFRRDIIAAYQSAFGVAPPQLISNETAVSAFLSSLRGDSRRSRSSHIRSKQESKPPVTLGKSVWDVDTLRTVERRLAAFIGPVARVVVKEAAANTTDLDQLYEIAAESLGSPEERSAFLARRPGTGDNNEARVASQGEDQGRDVESVTATFILPPAPRPAPPKAVAISRERFELKPVTPSKPPAEIIQPKAETSDAPDLRPNVKPESRLAIAPKAVPKIDKPPQSSAASQPELDIVARLEDLLGRQPENLAGYLAEKPPQVEQVIHAFVATVESLNRLYAAGGKSNGLTPQNVVFDRLGNASIQVSSATLVQGTTLGGVAGSPRYSAPEVFADKDVAVDTPVVNADIYSLGFMFYETLLGRTLFRTIFTSQRTDLDWLRWHADLKKKAPSLKSRLPDHPAALSELLESMMEKDAAKRANDLAPILARLRTVSQQSTRTMVSHKTNNPTEEASILKSSADQKTSTPSKRHTKRMVAILTIAVVLGIVGLVILQNPDFYRKSTAPASQPAQAPSSTNGGH